MRVRCMRAHASHCILVPDPGLQSCGPAWESVWPNPKNAVLTGSPCFNKPLATQVESQQPGCSWRPSFCKPCILGRAWVESSTPATYSSPYINASSPQATGHCGSSCARCGKSILGCVAPYHHVRTPYCGGLEFSGAAAAAGASDTPWGILWLMMPGIQPLTPSSAQVIESLRLGVKTLQLR